MPISAKDWYEPRPDLSSFYQGDIVKDVPVIFLPDKISKWFLLRPNLQGTKYIDAVLKGEICKWFEAFPEGQLKDAWRYGNREEFAAAKARLMNVILLTQSCDLEHRNYYQIAPIYPETAQKASALPLLRENGLNYTFFLPAFAPSIWENSYADLAHTTLIPKAYFPKDTVWQALGARLTELARTALQQQVAEYFGRPFGFAERDKARKTAEYACISCFYRTASSVKKHFEQDAHFTKCEICGEARWLRIVTAGEDPEQITEPVIRNDA
jgi:hypothetical protein